MKKQCKVCGAWYDTCYSCEKIKSWRVHTDIEEHYYIFCVLMDFLGGKDAKECYRALRKRGLDFADTNSFVPRVRELLSEIYSRSHNGKTLSDKSPNHTEKHDIDTREDTDYVLTQAENYSSEM